MSQGPTGVHRWCDHWVSCDLRRQLYTLSSPREVDCVELLSLPVDMMLTIASVLLSATAVDREEKKVGGWEGGRGEGGREGGRGEGRRENSSHLC